MQIEQMSVQEFKELQNSSNNNYYLIDVRERNEWDQGHIEGALHIPVGLIENKIEEEPIQKDALIITQCKTGGRSTLAAHILTDLGYQNVKNLTGGYEAYRKAFLQS